MHRSPQSSRPTPAHAGSSSKLRTAIALVAIGTLVTAFAVAFDDRVPPPALTII